MYEFSEGFSEPGLDGQGALAITQHLTWRYLAYCGRMSKMVIVGSGIRTGLGSNPGSAIYLLMILNKTLSHPQVSSVSSSAT